MKIALTCDHDMISEHFGHAPYFGIYEVKDNKYKLIEMIKSPGHQPGSLPKFLNELGINTLISGNMGDGAFRLFKEFGIEVIVGAKGRLDDVLKAFANGTLKSNNHVCTEHQHHHDHQH
ncbi:MAG: hypothetical protein A2009_01240 [Tenericutes bacterium GWD2_38_27]|nr:MAG: hypothetical protein A2009_01240 [Tenericutes bacterium GWD2_38_27]HBG32220.1 dinitrogenase iron-molybdenum cofactor [Acholeplasmataceae bacterium]HCB66005.1 dinitrogenase iron-molybdenum cofactor [Acholeplasmataceae bacterium]